MDRAMLGSHSRHFGLWPTTSGLPPEADIVRAGRHVSKVPISDIGNGKRSPPRRPQAVTLQSPIRPIDAAAAPDSRPVKVTLPVDRSKAVSRTFASIRGV